MRHILVFTLLLCLGACGTKTQPIRIATNPWPGYELLHLAEQLGYFEQAQVPIKLVQMNSLADSLREYQAGRVDGLTSTLVEVVQAQRQQAAPLKVVLLADYSNGGDLIITRKENPTMASLKGKRIGCEVSALGLVVLVKPLALQGLSITDVTLVNIEQLSGEKALIEGELDALVTYPPVSVNLLSQPNFHAVFSSREIPSGILDVVTIAAEQLNKHPQLPQQLMQVWGRAYQYLQEHPQDAYARMAQRENISPEDFKNIYLNDIYIYPLPEMQKKLQSLGWLDKEAQAVCNLLQGIEVGAVPCAQLPSIQL